MQVIVIPPAYTSKTCHACNHLGDRQGKGFKCENCGWHGDADYNGAVNIAKWGAAVNQPEGSRLFCSLDRDDEMMQGY